MNHYKCYKRISAKWKLPNFLLHFTEIKLYHYSEHISNYLYIDIPADFSEIYTYNYGHLPLHATSMYALLYCMYFLNKIFNAILFIKYV